MFNVCWKSRLFLKTRMCFSIVSPVRTVGTSDAYRKSLLKSSIVEDRQACRATCHLTRSTCQWVIPTVGSCLAGTQYRSSVVASVPLLCVGPYWVSAWWAWCARVLVLCWGPSGLLAAITSPLRFSWSVTNRIFRLINFYAFISLKDDWS